jgi:uncharacterized SAM-binding protein YcdF (DUF218 family)
MMTSEILKHAQVLWDYHHMQHTLQKSDCILVLGSHDTRVAERGAELILHGYAPIIVFSGGLGRLTKEMWTITEAELFAKIAIEKGVPEEKIILEKNSTNTGENIILSLKLLQQKGIEPNTFLLVQKPYMERRSFATFKKHLPHKNVLVTSPQISFKNYPTAEIPLEKVIQIMVGDLQRIKIYPQKGFQIEQEIPDNVWRSYEALVAAGFNHYVLKE